VGASPGFRPPGLREEGESGERLKVEEARGQRGPLQTPDLQGEDLTRIMHGVVLNLAGGEEALLIPRQGAIQVHAFPDKASTGCTSNPLWPSTSPPMPSSRVLEAGP